MLRGPVAKERTNEDQESRMSDVPTVHVCDRCKAMVEKCPVCRKKTAGK